MNEEREELDEELEEIIRIQLDDCKHRNDWDSEDSATRVNNLVKTYQLKMEQDKFKSEEKEKEQKIFEEKAQEKSQKKERRVDRVIKVVLEVGGIVIPLAFTSVFLIQGYTFEQKGVVTSPTFRNVLNWFRPRLNSK